MLSDAQQQLLHAWVDGETTDAESRSAIELLARPEASEYVSTLKRLRELLARHAGVTAPAGLMNRVRQALRSESGRSTLIRLSLWRVAGFAAAAAIMISVGLVFGPDLLREDTPPRVAVVDPTVQPAVTDKSAGDATITPDPAAPAFPGDEKLPGDAVEGKPEQAPEMKAKESAPTVLRLDRGLDQPFELSVHMDRNRDASNLQVYNDMLIVSSLYGDAELKDGAAGEEDFAGRDFSEFDGVAVEVEVDRVPELIAALNRMTADQAYGSVVVPNDLRQSIDLSAQAVSELEKVSRKRPPKSDTGNGGSATALGARGYLPPDVQRDCLEQELRDRPDELRRLNALDDREERIHKAGKSRSASETDSHKIKLILRLR
jgi:hypothetical protein